MEEVIPNRPHPRDGGPRGGGAARGVGPPARWGGVFVCQYITAVGQFCFVST